MLVVALAGSVWWFRASSRPKHVLLISVDTLQAGHLSCYGYEPNRTTNIDRLAGDGVLFENAVTSVPLTLPSHASIFTGRYPSRHGVVDNITSLLAEEEMTLAEILREHGFRTGAFVGAFVLDSRWGAAQGFDVYSDEFGAEEAGTITRPAVERSGDEVLTHALAWIDEKVESPLFAFVHFFDPHAPYEPPEPYRSRCDDEPVGCYDGEVSFVDNLIGELITHLEQQGLYEDTLIVFVGDHGESLGAHGESTHGIFLYDATVKVPLILAGPGIDGSRRIRAQVRTVDILPTVLDLLGLPLPSRLDGESLVPILSDSTRTEGFPAYVESQYSRLHFGWAPLRGIRSDRYKYIEAPRRELYDLVEDPEERRNLAADRPEVVERLASTLDALQSKGSGASQKGSLPGSETLEKLRSLGYVTSPVKLPATTPPLELPDPKDKIGLFNRIVEARQAGDRGDADRSLRLLASVAKEDPGVTLAHLMMGNILLSRGEFRRAETVFGSVLQRDNLNLEAVFGLALAHKGLGRYREAAAQLERCLELEPKQSRATYKLAEVLLALGQAPEAERLLSTLRDEALDTSARLLLADAFLSQGKRDEALRIAEAIDEQNPSDERVLLSLGNLFLEAQVEQRAVRAYRRAARAPAVDGSSVPEEAEVFDAVGQLLARHGDLSGSALAFRKAVHRRPSFVPAYNNLGIVLAQLGQFESAERAFRQAVEKGPGFAEAYNNLGYLYLQTGKTNEAVGLFRRALAIDPGYAEARANLEAALNVR